jgi:hypothetical protein
MRSDTVGWSLRAMTSPSVNCDEGAFDLKQANKFGKEKFGGTTSTT